MSYLKWMPASSEPSGFCGRYSTIDLRERAASPSPTGRAAVVALGHRRDDHVVHLDHEELLLALAGLPARDRRFLQVLPGGASLQQERRRLVDLVGEGEVVERRLPRAAAASRRSRPAFVTPQDQLSTSISSLCLSSSDSPLMSPSFAKMSDATTTSPRSGSSGVPGSLRRSSGAGQPRSRSLPAGRGRCSCRIRRNRRQRGSARWTATRS